MFRKLLARGQHLCSVYLIEATMLALFGSPFNRVSSLVCRLFMCSIHSNYYLR